MHEHAEVAVVLSTERGFPLWAATGTTLRGWALAMQSQGEAGLAQVCQGIAAWRATGAVLFVSWFCTMLAEVCDHLGHTKDGLQALAEVETWLRRALDLARHQEAKALELRAAISLARLRQQQGRHAEACDLLAPVYGWFTEGFDTVDLQEAKALLEELGR